MKLFCLFYLIILILGTTVCSDPMRIPTRPEVKIPSDMTKINDVTYTKEARSTIHGENVQTAYLLNKPKGHMKDKVVKNRSIQKFAEQNNFETAECSFIQSLAVWDGPIDIVIDPQNDDGLTEQYIVDTIENGFALWQQSIPFSIIRNITVAPVPFDVDISVPDGSNTIFFAVINQPGVIALTANHGIFEGENQGIFESDIVFNLNFNLVNAQTNPSGFDFPTVTNHEIGHLLGGGHTENIGPCQDSTMAPTLAQGDFKPYPTESDFFFMSFLYSGPITNFQNSASYLEFCYIVSFLSLFVLF